MGNRPEMTESQPGSAGRQPRTWLDIARLTWASVCLLVGTVSTAGVGKPVRYKAGARHAGISPVSFKTEVLPILKRRCAVGTGCHAGDTAAAGLRLDGPKPYAALVGARSSLQPDRMRVMPRWPRKSVLWLKVTGKQKQAGIFGDRMPPDKPLSGAELGVIRRWIDRGGAP